MKVLYIGGTGEISYACVQRSLEVGQDVVVRVDDTKVYTTKAKLDGTVTVYPAHGSTISVSEIYITGVPEAGREVSGHSHASTF